MSIPSQNTRKTIVIVGPTASGKSSLAIDLARRFNGEIISADSRQVYRGMDLGTGKVSKREQRLARHWLLDVADPRRTYTAARFHRDATRAMANIRRRGKLPIICGGTGFYVDALLGRTVLPDVPPNSHLRAQLSKLSTAQLFAKLQKLDPRRAAHIDPRNPRRLIRALEIIAATGRPIPARDIATAARSSDTAATLWIGITWRQDMLNQRIEQRLDQRLRQGILREVTRLHDNGVSWKRLEAFGLEYRWAARYLQHKISKSEMRTRLLGDIQRYAKRQMTWFKRNPNIHWVSGTDPLISTQDLVKAFRED